MGWEMLSRIAESMFWIGRYVERAEEHGAIPADPHLRMLYRGHHGRRGRCLSQPPGADEC